MNRQFFAEDAKSRYLNLADVSTTTARGTSYTGYRNQKTFFSGQLSDAAKAELVALSAVEEAKLPTGNFQYNARYRTIYPDTSDVTFTAGEPTAADVSEFNTNAKDGVIIEPTQESVQTFVQWNANRNNIYNLMKDKQEELSYALATKVENFILQDATNGLISATVPTDATTRGAFVVYGGASKTADNLLATGDILTVQTINEANTKLMSRQQYYRSGGTGAAVRSDISKNPWKNVATDPFVLMIAPEQMQSLLSDTQFLYANQYGGREALLNGEIGKVFNIKIVVSQYMPFKETAGTGWDGSTTLLTDISRCILMKGRAAYTYVWGQEPTFVMDKKLERTKDQMVLWTTYSGDVVHDDAIVFLDVATI